MKNIKGAASLFIAAAIFAGTSAAAFAESPARSDDEYEPIVVTTPVQDEESAASRAEGSSVSEEASGAAVEEQTSPGTIRYSDIAERISQNAASDALDKQLDALKHTEMSVLTRDSIVYQIRLSKVGREKAAAEMTRAAQKAYTDIIRLDGSIESLKGALERAERMIAALKIRKKYNLATQIELDEAQHAIDELTLSIEKADLSRRSLAMQLSFLCGGESGSELFPAGVPEIPSEEMTSSAGSDADYYSAKKSSFDLRSLKEDLWYAENFQNDKSESAAKADSVQTEQKLRISFEAAVKTLSEKRLAIKSALSAVSVEKDKLASAQLKYRRGIISLYELKEQELALGEAERAYNVSLLDLVDAWEDYCWIVKGLDQSSGA